MKFSYSFLVFGALLGLFSSSVSAQLLAIPSEIESDNSEVAVSFVQPQAETAIQDSDNSDQDEDKAQQDEFAVGDDDLMLLNCNNWPWQRVIEVFTDKTGLALQPVSDYPEGALTLFENERYTVMEGLDKLNMNLAIKGYTLVRKGNQLFLVELRDLLPQMVETVTPEALEKRGLHEIMRVTFDLTGLDADDLEQSISRVITDRNHREELVYVPSVQTITVRERGQTLREIKSWVDTARAEAVKKAPGRKRYKLENFPPEQILVLARPFLGMGKDENVLTYEDGTKLIIGFDPLDDYILVESSNERIDQVFELLKDLDVPPPAAGDVEVLRKTVETHPVDRDPELAMQVMQTMFEGRDVRMDQDQQTGDIVLFGTAQDHKDALEYLAVLNKPNRGNRLIPLEHKTQTEMIGMLMPLLGISTSVDTEDESAISGNGPRIVAVPDSDFLFVSGTPQQANDVEAMVKELDVPSGESLTATPSTLRYIPMSDGEARRISELAPEVFPVTGRRNPVRLLNVLPKDRGIPRRSMVPQPTIDQLEREFEESLPPLRRNSDNDQSQNELDLSQYQFVSTPMVQDEDETVGETSDDDKKKSGDYYQPPQVPESKPGSPITMKIVDGGLVVESDDLSALDDMVDLIYDLQAEVSEADMPAVFYLDHRRADAAKAMLDQLLGLASSSSGGGGGGMGNIMGNMMSNALGPAGDIFGGLLGGGGGTGGGLAGGYVLEGDVSTIADLKLNSIVVQGHTLNDFDMISMYIDYIDQPESPADPDLGVGKMVRIDVVYRDPEFIRDVITEALGDFIDSGESGGGGGNPQQQQQQMMQQMLRAMGGGGGNQSSVDPEAEKPKAKISVDTERPALIVTGPIFIIRKIEEMVAANDTPLVLENQRSATISLQDIDPALVAEYLQLVYDGTLMFTEGGVEQSGGNGSGGGGNTGGNNAAQAIQAQQRAAMQNFARMMQARGGQGGGRGGQGGGRGGQGGGRGGGGRGGGGR